MRPTLTAVVAAIEAIAVALTGLVAVAIPVLLLWVVTFDMAAEPSDVLGYGAAVWLLAHCVPLSFALTPEAAVSFGLAPEALSFTLSLVPLGLTLITLLLAGRSGWRFGRRGGMGAAGVFGGAVGFAAAASAVVAVAPDTLAWPAWLAITVPALCYTVASLAGFLVRAARDEHPWWGKSIRWEQRVLQRIGVPGTAALPSRLAEMLRIAAALLATLFGVSALALTTAIVAGYVSVTTLTQSLQLDALGAFLLFLVHGAFLPTALIWSASWLTGSGFAVGAGSSASPFGALLGPMPALPLFGAIPQGWGSAGVLAPALLVLGGIGVGVLFTRRPELRKSTWPVVIGIIFTATALTGLVLAGVVVLATGSIGPDRLGAAGPSPWLTAGLAAAELGGGMLLGVFGTRVDSSRLRNTVSSLLPDRVQRSSDRVFESSNVSDFAAEPDLHDPTENQETVELLDEGDTRAIVAETTEKSSLERVENSAIDVEGPETEGDELLRAFAWNGSGDIDPDPQPAPRRSGWLRSRKER